MQPVEIVGMEPALSSAQLVLSTLLGPPLVWPWNRSILAFASGTNQDYQALGLNDWGFLEGGTVQPVSGGKSMELQVKLVLHSDQSNARPYYCGPLLDDGAGNITFRLNPSPDQNYNVKLIYQRKTPRIQSLAYTWAPVPDDLAYIPMWGFLAMMSLIGNDARFNEYNQKFVTAVLSAQGGLTDLERNIFIGNWMRVASQITSTQMATQERFRAREQ
jgi:hypothetical protein